MYFYTFISPSCISRKNSIRRYPSLTVHTGKTNEMLDSFPLFINFQNNEGVPDHPQAMGQDMFWASTMAKQTAPCYQLKTTTTESHLVVLWIKTRARAQGSGLLLPVAQTEATRGYSVYDSTQRVQEGFVRMSGSLAGMAGRPGRALTTTYNPSARLLQQDSPRGSGFSRGGLGLLQRVPIKQVGAASF